MALEADRPHVERDPIKMDKEDALKAMREEKPLWQNMPSEEAIEESTEIIDLLKKYDRAVPGINTSRFRETLKKEGNKPKELAKLKIKLNKVAIKEWERRAEEHEAFNAPGKLGAKLKKERKELWASFKGQDLLEGEYSKFQLLIKMDEMLEPKAKFVKRYKKQTPYVQKLYEKSMSELDFTDSKEKLLDKVLKIVGDLEHSPQAIQNEFNKRTSKIKDLDRIKVLKAQLIKEYGKMEEDYAKAIKDNKEYFGGETAKEFLEWFGEQKSFTKMKYALKKLPKYIAERKKEHLVIKDLLDQMPKKQSEKFWNIINKLGLSERKAFRKETLEPAFKTGNIMVAEYEGELLAAHQDRVPLYTPIEKIRLASKFKRLNAKQQKQVLSVERLNIANRSQVIREYKALPYKIRKDAKFYAANSIDREEILHKAQQKIAENNSYNPFAELDEEEHITDEQIRDIGQALESNTGQDALDEAFHEQVGEREKKNINNVISLAKWKMDNALIASRKNQTQQERFADDLENWKVGISIGDRNKDASLESDQLKASKIREMQIAEDLYEKGITTHSGSTTHKRRDLKRGDLLNMKGEKISEAMSLATYDTDIFIAEDDEREPVDVAAMLGEVVEEIAERMAKEMVEGLADKINAKGRNRLSLVNSLNSAKNMESIKNKFWDNEMGERGQVLRKKRLKKAA